MPLEILSHNVNGYDRNKEFIRDTCCSLPISIYGLQEHWLRPPSKKYPGVNVLKTLHPDLDGWGRSAMKSKMETKILNGRPFGGTGFIWSKTISSLVKPRNEYNHERITVLEINSSLCPILVINCYLPYFNSNDIVSQTDIYVETVGFIDYVINDNPGASIIVMGDMNCDYYNGTNQFALALKDLVAEHGLYCTYDSMNNFDARTCYTRSNVKQASFSLLDYIFVSRNLIPHIVDVSILDSGDVLSDHIPVKITLDIDLSIKHTTTKSLPSVVNWRGITDSVRKNFENVMEDCLNKICIPDILHGKKCCNDLEHIHQIEDYYLKIVDCIRVADLQLPRCRPTTIKGYWNDELSSLKHDSIVAHDFWKMNGSPRNGPIFEAKKHAYYKYKLYLKKCKFGLDQERVDSLNEDLINGDQNKFWRSYKYFNYSNCNKTSHIDGISDDAQIAEVFAKGFNDIYRSVDVAQSSKLLTEFHDRYKEYSLKCANDTLDDMYLSWNDMIDVLSKLKTGKASASFIKAEHIMYGSPKLAWHLHLLFNSMIQHSYVPCEFLNGVITPLIKDTEGDHSDPSNYRGLTLGVVFAFLFEHAMLKKIGCFLNTDNVQFGYKKRHSTSHAIYCLKECIDYFTSRGSNVFAAFLDCSKGFDKVNHSGMFIKLMNRGLPLCFLNLLIYWYSNLTSLVKWNGVFSKTFRVCSGVRQGGVLSPRLFAIYIDDLILQLKKLNIGCHIIEIFLACIVYADDICLLAPCRSALQLLLDTCVSYGFSWCLSYNPSKSKVMCFGKITQPPTFSMYGKNLEYVDRYKYLGVTIVAGSMFSTSHLKSLIRFRSSANTVLNVHQKPSEQILMKMLYATCVPHLTYASDVIHYSSGQMHPLNVALNDCIRRIFTFNRWESVRYLRLSFGYPSLVEIFESRSRKFLKQLSLLGNSTLEYLQKLHEQ